MSYKWRDAVRWPVMGYGPIVIDARVGLLWIINGLAYLADKSIYVFPLTLAVTSIYVYCKVKRINFNFFFRYMRKKLIKGKRRGTPMSRQKSIFNLAICFIVSSFIIVERAEADFVLIPAEDKPTSYTSSNIKSGMPEINSGARHKLVSSDVRLTHILKTVIPSTWRVRYSSSEVADLKVDLRANNLTVLEILQDLATRYGVKFSYGSTSGIVRVDWVLSSECRSHADLSVKENIIC